MDEINKDSPAYIMARIETKLDTIIAKYEAHAEANTLQFREQDRRLDSLETTKSWIIGVTATLGGLAILFKDKLAAAFAGVIN